jgi:type I restriction enzyme S subunit
MMKYSEYKFSGIVWLGDIPDHWEVKRLKEVSNIVNGSTPKSNIEEFWDGTITWITPSDISKLNGFIYESGKSITEEGYQSCGTKMVPINSTILTCRAPIGNTVIAGKKLCTNQGCKSLISLTIEYRYLYYFILSANKEITSLGQGTTFLELSRTNLGDTKLAFPQSKEEQTAIAHYLDEKTSKLDLLISNKKAQIKKLKEIRQIEINTAVTKGLDPKVKLKSSGDVWLGDVPVHWRVRRLKEMTSRIGDGIHSTPNYVNNSNYFFVNGNNLINKTITINDSTNCVSEEEFKSYNLKLEPKTILLSINGTIGNLAFYKGESVVFGKSIAYMQCFDLYNEVYIHYFLQSSFVQTMFELSYAGTTIKNLSLNTIRNTKIAFPKEISEQLLIAEYLNNKTSKIDQLVSNLENQINQLQEIRKIEIYNAVTGKIKA